MKVTEENVKLGQHLNRLMWIHGIKNPPAKVTVNVTKGDDGIVYAELAGKEYLGSVKPLAKTEEAQGLKGKLESALGKKHVAGSDAAAEKKDKKESPDVRTTPMPKVPKHGMNAHEEH